MSSRIRFRLAWLGWALFVCYGTTFPFNADFSIDRARARLQLVSLNPLLRAEGGERVSLPDVAQNVLLFFPFGMAGALSISGRARRRVLLTGAAAAALSLSLEVVQLFTWDRTAASSDIVFDTLGATAGALVASLGVSTRWVANGSRHAAWSSPSIYPFLCAAALLCASAWAPFDFTFDVSTLAAKARTFFADPWAWPPGADLSVEFVVALLAGATSAVAVTDSVDGRRKDPAFLGALLAAVLAGFAECAAAFVESTNPSASMLLLHLVVVLIGALLYRQLFKWPWWSLAVVALVAVLGMRFDTSPAVEASGSAAASSAAAFGASAFRASALWSFARYAAATYLASWTLRRVNC